MSRVDELNALGCIWLKNDLVLVDKTKLQYIYIYIYRGADQPPEELVDLPEHCGLYPPLDLCVDARAVYEEVSASDVCVPAESGMTIQLISVRDRIFQGIFRNFFWIDKRDGGRWARKGRGRHVFAT